MTEDFANVYAYFQSLDLLPPPFLLTRWLKWRGDWRVWQIRTQRRVYRACVGLDEHRRLLEEIRQMRELAGQQETQPRDGRAAAAGEEGIG